MMSKLNQITRGTVIPVGLGSSIAVALMGVSWWAATVYGRVGEVEIDTAANTERIEEHAERLHRLDLLMERIVALEERGAP